MAASLPTGAQPISSARLESSSVIDVRLNLIDRSVKSVQLARNVKEDVEIVAEVAIGSGILDVVTLRQQNPADSTSVLRQRTAVPQALESDTSLAPGRRPPPRVLQCLRSQISDPVLRLPARLHERFAPSPPHHMGPLASVPRPLPPVSRALSRGDRSFCLARSEDRYAEDLRQGAARHQSSN